MMYIGQEEIRLAVLPGVLAPLLLILTALCIGLAVAAILLVLMIKSLTGP